MTSRHPRRSRKLVGRGPELAGASRAARLSTRLVQPLNPLVQPLGQPTIDRRIAAVIGESGIDQAQARREDCVPGRWLERSENEPKPTFSGLASTIWLMVRFLVK
jgi:hypothetical protein